MLWSAHRCSTCLVALTLGVIPRKLPATFPYTGMPAAATGPGNRVGGQERASSIRLSDVSAAWVRLKQQGAG